LQLEALAVAAYAFPLTDDSSDDADMEKDNEVKAYGDEDKAFGIADSNEDNADGDGEDNGDGDEFGPHGDEDKGDGDEANENTNAKNDEDNFDGDEDTVNVDDGDEEDWDKRDVPSAAQNTGTNTTTFLTEVPEYAGQGLATHVPGSIGFSRTFTGGLDIAQASQSPKGGVKLPPL
jgi:hypothetical protein